jgi:hypothetical protein
MTQTGDAAALKAEMMRLAGSNAGIATADESEG